MWVVNLLKLNCEKMKRNLIVMAVLAISLVSCTKEELESPGNIQGMGSKDGDLEVKEPFVITSGTGILGEISGLEKSDSEAKGAGDGEIKGGFPLFGSGEYFRLKLTLVNFSDVPRTVFFPKGLLWQCTTPGYQHGMLLQTTWVTLEANAKRTILMDMCCLNYYALPPDDKAVYRIIGISGSKVIGKLLDYIKWRKINHEMICGSFGGEAPVNTQFNDYKAIAEKIQAVVRKLTDEGRDISAEDIAFIESLQELSPNENPLFGSLTQFPLYFKEFVAPGQ